MESVPFEVSATAAYPTPESWQAEAPDTVRRMVDRWELQPAGAFTGGIAGAVLRVTQRDGTAAVLKVAYPHVEGLFEAVGLQSFPDGLAPEVLRQDPWTWSMLLSEVTPGTPLRDSGLAPEEAIGAGAALLAELMRGVVPDTLPRLADAMRDYVEQGRARLPGQARALSALGVGDLVAGALDELEDLAGSDVGNSLLHGDFNPGNILRSAGETGWMVVDPKPLVGDPAFDLWPLISQIGDPFTAGDPVARLRSNLTIACSAAGQDPIRVARWGAARTGLNVSWYLAAGDQTNATATAHALRTWAAVARG